MNKKNRLSIVCYLVWVGVFYLHFKDPLTDNLSLLLFTPLFAFTFSFLIIALSEVIIEKITSYKLAIYQNSEDDGFTKYIYLSTVIAFVFLVLKILPYLNVGDVPDDLMY